MITNIRNLKKNLESKSVEDVPIYYTDRNGYLQWGKIVNIHESVNEVGNNYNHNIVFVIRNKLNNKTIIYTKSFVHSSILESVNWDLILSNDKIEYKNE